MESLQVAMLTGPAAALVAGAGSTDTDAVGTSHGKKRLKTGPESVQRLGFAEPEEGGEEEEGGAEEDKEDDGAGALGPYGTARPMDTDSSGLDAASREEQDTLLMAIERKRKIEERARREKGDAQADKDNDD